MANTMMVVAWHVGRLQILTYGSAQMFGGCFRPSTSNAAICSQMFAIFRVVFFLSQRRGVIVEWLTPHSLWPKQIQYGW